jgi:protein-tyrosine phosphatase/nicotinamidase-related amidase
MSNAILITDCLQWDFVGPLGRFDPLPNALHIGHQESWRLMGEDPKQGPVARVIEWAHQQSDAELRVIHVRDWHDRSDARQQPHLQQFGEHCIKSSDGARFVFGLDRVTAGKQVRIVDATTLSNFIDADLEAALALDRQQLVRIGLMGVWTEAKITFLAYDLRSRYPLAQLAVCSALTASSSRHNHFLALDQMERLLGVRVFASIGDFVAFLGGTVDDAPLSGFTQKHPELEIRDATAISTVDRQLLRYLFRGCRKVSVRSLDGGFSGNRVLATQSTDLHWHEEVPHVVKIGAQGLIGQERTAFERIEAVLGNAAPRIADFADWQQRGAIKYRYAAMGNSASLSFQKIYTAGSEPAQVQRVLDAVFVEQLGRLYQAAEPERCDLLEYYQFSPRWAPHLRQRVRDIVGEAADDALLDFPGERRVANITAFYATTLASLPRSGRAHYFAHVHGDLNGANIIIDGPGNVWLIDFFHSHRGHVLRDLIKLENDVLYIYTALEDEAQLHDALALTDHLLSLEDLGAVPATPTAAASWAPGIARALATVQQLRSYYAPLIKADRDISQLLIAQIRYAVHTLGFEECSPLQKRWALYTACSAATALTRQRTQIQHLRIDWLPAQHTDRGRLGLTWLPGRKDAGRVLADDVAALKAQATDSVVCLLSAEEFVRYGVEDLLSTYRSSGLEVFALPIVDQRIPQLEQMQELQRWLTQQIQQARSVVVHCVGGLGRAGTVAGCWLRTRGMDAAAAIELVRAVRSQRAIETAAQEHFVAEYHDS